MAATAKFNRAALAAMCLGSALASAPQAHAGVDPFIGELMLMGNNFCPRGYASASGQLLAISQNTALFSLLGTNYGGNGTTTFALPNLNGRAPIGVGQGPGLSNYVLGEVGGQESFTLLVTQMPTHTHLVQATNSFADKPGPGDKFLAADNNGVNKYHDGPANKTMNAGMISQAGGNQPVSHRGPFLAMTWCIALQGIFPPRD